MKRKDIEARLRTVKADAKAILDSADAAGGALNEDQREKFDALMIEADALAADLDRVKKIESLDAATPRVVQPVAIAEPVITGGAPAIEKDPMAGFKSVAEFARSVQIAGLPGQALDPRLQVLAAPSNTHKELGSSDGYMVPPQVAADVVNLVNSDESFLSRVSPEPTSSNQVGLLIDETTPWGSTGVQAYWGSEAGQMTSSKLSTKQRYIQLEKLYAFVNASEELLEDAPRLQNRLTVKAAEAIRYKADEALINGDGVGKPEGYMSSAALVTVAKETSQSADTIVAANVLKMRARLLGSANGAFWMVHQSTIPQLATMTIGDQPMWLPNNAGLLESVPGRLLGLPVVISEHAQTVGDKGDIQLVQPNGYFAAVKSGGPQFAMSMHLYFDYGVSAFRWTFRLAGSPLLSAPVSPDNGSDTLSHFITLAARA